MKREELKSQLVRNVRSSCDRYGIPEPSQFLAEVMAGRDPRHLGDVYTEAAMVQHEMKTNPCPICDGRAQRLVELVVTNERYHHNPVEFTASLLAAEKLLSYMYPKLKQVEHMGSVDVPQIPRMTEDERVEFLTKFRNAWGQAEREA